MLHETTFLQQNKEMYITKGLIIVLTQEMYGSPRLVNLTELTHSYFLIVIHAINLAKLINDIVSWSLVIIIWIHLTMHIHLWILMKMNASNYSCHPHYHTAWVEESWSILR